MFTLMDFFKTGIEDRMSYSNIQIQD